MTIPLPPEYGYVILVGVGSGFVLTWMGLQVSKARKRFGVKYPQMYDDSKPHFNCYQRAHQNTLENYTQFLMLLFIGGLKHPLISSAAGVVYLVGRITYALGYYTGNPENRQRGGFQYAGLFTLVGTSVSTALSLLGYI